VRQFVGMGGGVVLAILLVNLWPNVLDYIQLGNLLTWFAILGASILSWQQIERAGAALTRRDDRVLNLLVGFGVPIILILVVMVTL
jgi:hypothetical protein